MFDALVAELSQRYGLGERSRELFGLLVGYIYNDRRGGFDGFIESFRLQGHAQQAGSWASRSLQPLPVTASEVGMVFGQGLLSDWGMRLGVSRATVATAIAGILPRLVAELTPGRERDGHDDDGSGLGPDPVSSGNISVDQAATTAFAEGSSAYSLPATATGAAAPVAPVPAATPSTARAAGVDDTRTPPRDSPAPHALGRVVPRNELGPAAAVPAAVDTRLRREPTLGPGSGAPTPAAATALSPAEQRVADMTAALGGNARASSAGLDDEPGNGKFDTWRPAIHRPERRKSRWPYWLVIVLLLAAAIGVAWYLGLIDTFIAPYLDPLLQRYGVKIMPPPMR